MVLELGFDRRKIFVGRYHVGDLLRSDRCIATYRARDLELGKEVILKLVSRTSMPPARRERAERALRAFQDSRGALANEVGLFGETENMFWLVTPFAPGSSLGQLLAKAPLPLETVLWLGCEALRVLRPAHALGVFHRNLKPADMIVEPLQSLRITDFALSRGDVYRSSIDELRPEEVRYMSPERAGLLELEPGAPADLFSLGAILFEALRGAPFYPETSVQALLREGLVPCNPLLRAHGIRVPRALEELLQRLLRKDPLQRYQSAEGVLADLQRIRNGSSEIVIGLGDSRSTLATPAFVGRDAQLEALDQGLEDAFRGRGGVLLVESESGGGKSTLLAELHVRCQQRRVWTLRGQGVALSAQKPLRFLQTLFDDVTARLVAEEDFREELRARLSGRLDALGEVVPSLAGALGWKEQGCRPGPDAAGESRTLAALTELLLALGSARMPVALLLDDFQWADRFTQALLQRLKKVLSDWHGMVVLFFRSEEVAAQHPIRELGTAPELVLEPFRLEETRLFCGSALGGEPGGGALPPQIVDTVFRFSRGNPFMAQATLQGMFDSGALVPLKGGGWAIESQELGRIYSSGTVSDFLGQRFQRLSDDARKLLSVGAVLGKDFRLSLAAELTGISSAGASVAVREARRWNILWHWDYEGRHFFVHDRFREALLGGLSPEERRALHLRAAQAIRDTDSDAVFEIAYHFEAGGRPDRALPYALEASARARRQNSLELAEQYLKIAEIGAADGDPDLRRGIHAELGQALVLRGDYEEGERRLRLAMELSEGGRETIELSLRLGEVLFKKGEMARALSCFEGALRTLGYQVPRTRGRLLLCLAGEILVQISHLLLPRAFWRRGASPPENEFLAIDLFQAMGFPYFFAKGGVAVVWTILAALNRAERIGHPSAQLARAYAATSQTLAHLGLFKPAFAYFDKAMNAMEEVNDPWCRGRTLFLLGGTQAAAVNLRKAIELHREAVVELERAGDLWAALNCSWQIARSQFALGELREAAEKAKALLARARHLGDRQTMIGAFELLAKTAPELSLPCDEGSARQELEVGEGDLATQALLDQAHGIRLIRLGKFAEAIEVLERGQRGIDAIVHRQPYIAPIHWLVLALRRQFLATDPYAIPLRRRRIKKAQSVARAALRLARATPGDLPRAWRELGILAALNWKPGRAERLLLKSRQIASSNGMRLEQALTELELGRLRLSQGDPAGKSQVLAARDAISAAGADFYLNEIHGPELGGEALTRGSSDAISADTVSLLERFSLLQEMGRKVVSMFSRDGVFEALLEAMGALLRCDHCRILEVRPNGQAVPWDGGPADAEPVGGNHALLIRAVQEWRVETGEDPSRSELCVPVIARREVIACVYARNSRVGGLFGRNEKKLAEFIAMLAGAAIENAEGLQQEREAVRVRDEFLALASHELKTPLTPIKLNLQLLMRLAEQGRLATFPQPQLQETLRRSDLQMNRLSRLIEDLLDVSRIRAGRLTLAPEDCDLALLVKDVVSDFEPELLEKGIVLEARLGPAHVRADRGRIEQVVTNLLSNAVKYGMGKPIEVTLEASGGRARLTVRDQGIGIAREDQGRIFGRFEQAASPHYFGGLGLGLYLAKQIVDSHAGTIGIESAPGQGAAFTVELAALKES